MAAQKARALLLDALFLMGFCSPAQGAVSLTVYPDNMAVVREDVQLQLKKGLNEVRFSDVSGFLDATSVSLRPSRGAGFRLLEQTFSDEAGAPERLMRDNIGREVEFVKDGPDSGTVKGRILRPAAGASYVKTLYANNPVPARQAIVEVDGKLRLGLPGAPLFPSTSQAPALESQLEWLIESGGEGKADAELGYMTSNLSWQADYNVICADGSEACDLTGWVTITNKTGRTFRDADVKLMGGGTAPPNPYGGGMPQMSSYWRGLRRTGPVGAVPVERSFEENLLYALPRKTTIEDGTAKQVQFVSAGGLKAARRYVYDGLRVPASYRSYPQPGLRVNSELGSLSDPKVWVVLDVDNSKKNGLGAPLPDGRVRVYRAAASGRLGLASESFMDAAEPGEVLRLRAGDAAGLEGERRRTHFFTAPGGNMVQEKYEIVVRNRGGEAAKVNVVEHLVRSSDWEISQNSAPFKKTDDETIEFALDVPASGEAKVAYEVHYAL